MAIIGKEKLTIESIYEKLMEKKFTNTQLTLQILINSIMQNAEKYDLTISKVVSILSKFISN